MKNVFIVVGLSFHSLAVTYLHCILCVNAQLVFFSCLARYRVYRETIEYDDSIQPAYRPFDPSNSETFEPRRLTARPSPFFPLF